jgi:hypothetical protein
MSTLMITSSAITSPPCFMIYLIRYPQMDSVDTTVSAARPILDIARAMQLPLRDLPAFQSRHRIGIRRQGLILRPAPDGTLAWSRALWSLIPPGAIELLPAGLSCARRLIAHGRSRLIAARQSAGHE